MQKFVLTILLTASMAFLTFIPANAQQLRLGPVVASFGGECSGKPFHPSARLKRLIEKTKQLEVSPCNWPSCDGAFAYDLDGRRRDELFVRLSCGATGNCTWGIFSDSPARLLGTFTAWFLYIHKQRNGWKPLSTYTRIGGDQGIIATLENRKGKYVQVTERTEQGHYGNPQPFLKRMGVPKCDVASRAR